MFSVTGGASSLENYFSQMDILRIAKFISGVSPLPLNHSGSTEDEFQSLQFSSIS